VIIICIGIAYLFGLQFYMGGLGRIIFAVAFVMPIGVGLWFLKTPARWLVSTIIMLLVIFLPIGFFKAAIHELGPNPPETWQLVLAIYRWVAVGLLLVHILGKHKGEFTPLFKKSNT
jgi:hypothetical protein